ncbi:Rec8 like protein-domain-containing protein [Xylaria intraflava]|nr:Rec8 like protein-domain-containing protein [Xylaria intraflava]
MFYSHEILTSRQYGVSTIWLVATIGNKSSTRKVTRKAIQEVDVQRACGKILEPGAPIALRLQGNLLYGVSRVHNQQCTYLITDAKKIQDQMKLFVKSFPGNQLDPEAGKARPENLLIENDPAFDPDMPLPLFELETLFSSKINTQKTSSQMSPFQSSQSSRQSLPIQLDIDASSSSGHHESPFGLQGLSSAQKPDDEPLIFPTEDDAFGAQGDWGLEIDENGNIIELAGPMVVDEEPQLPPLPHVWGEDKVSVEAPRLNDEHNIENQGDVIMQEEPLPEAAPFPERRQHAVLQNGNQRSRGAFFRKKRKLQIDDETQLSRNILREWQYQYLGLCGAHVTRPTSSVQAKRNAMLLTFGLGIGNIGQSVGVPGLSHPLATEYSGDTLFTVITGIEVQEPRGRRRTASEAIIDGQEEGRRVRPRLVQDEKEQEQARVTQEDEFINFDDPFADGILPETGRQAEQPMSDHLSSTLLPWNRGSSAVPGSSIRAPNPAKQGRDLSSPLNRRRDPQDIVRYSDDAPVGGFGSDDNFGDGFGSADVSFDGMANCSLDSDGHMPEVASGAGEIQSQEQRLFEQLDGEGHRFINFVQDAVNENGEYRQDEDLDMNRKWVAFNDLFVPRTTPRSTAAQAFYQTLSLSTKRKMYVEQDGAIDEPFGAIWIGLKTIAGGF